MVDFQSVTAEIRRGKKEERRKKQDKNIMSTSAMQGGHNNCILALRNTMFQQCDCFDMLTSEYITMLYLKSIKLSKSSA